MSIRSQLIDRLNEYAQTFGETISQQLFLSDTDDSLEQIIDLFGSWNRFPAAFQLARKPHTPGAKSAAGH